MAEQEEHDPSSRSTSRVEGTASPIDYDATLEFFEGRAGRAQTHPILTTVLYQDSEPELARQRDAAEWARAREWFELSRSPRVLDVGCGIGRWGVHLAHDLGSYLGVDFSPGLVALAREQLANHLIDREWSVQVGSATELAQLELDIPGPFDLAIIAGVLVYLNDDDVAVVVDGVASLMADRAQVYLREPVATTQRLTLQRHWSDELDQEYSAVYRPAAFYRDVWSARLREEGFRLSRDEELDRSLRNRAETTQHFFLWERP